MAGQRCPICLEDFSVQRGRRVLRSAGITELASCGHAFCLACIQQYIRFAIDEGKSAVGELSCPVPECRAPIEETQMRSIVTPATWDKHKLFLQQRLIDENSGVRRCPAPKCGRVIRLPKDDKVKSLECPKCKCVFCPACGLEPHLKISCEEVEMPHTEDTCHRAWICPHCSQACDKAYGGWKAAKQAKRCPKCRYQTLKTGGCNMISCVRCGGQWCWGCGEMNGGCTCLVRYMVRRRGKDEPMYAWVWASIRDIILFFAPPPLVYFNLAVLCLFSIVFLPLPPFGTLPHVFCIIAIAYNLFCLALNYLA